MRVTAKDALTFFTLVSSSILFCVHKEESFSEKVIVLEDRCF